MGSRFNAALIDCGGCIDTVWGTGLFQQLELVLIEEDPPGKSYAPWHVRLADAGFERIWYAHDTFSPSWRLMHAAWQRRGGPPAPTCEQYARANNYSAHELNCVHQNTDDEGEDAKQFKAELAKLLDPRTRPSTA